MSTRIGCRRVGWLIVCCLLAAAFVFARSAIDQHRFFTQAVTGPVAATDECSTGRELYAKYCSACHGEQGDGRGVAARYLNPKARNLQTGSFRLVSTENGVPSLADVEAVLEKGIPGTSMRSYRELSAGCRQKLVNEVFRLRRQGVRNAILQALREEWPNADPPDEDVEQLLDVQLKAGPAVAVPTFHAASPEAVARGRVIFLKFTCNTCHGDDATGQTDLRLTDEAGAAIRPRNLVADQLKGGREPESVYRRILLGIPGSPMPACRLLTEAQRIDLVSYILSLGREPHAPSTNFSRALRAIYNSPP